jgi:hypothetical protein
MPMFEVFKIILYKNNKCFPFNITQYTMSVKKSLKFSQNSHCNQLHHFPKQL